MKGTLYLILIMIIGLMMVLNFTLNRTIINLNNKITKLNAEIFTLNVKLNYKDSIHRDHLNRCAMISKDQLRYGKDNIVYIKDIYRLTYDLGE